MFAAASISKTLQIQATVISFNRTVLSGIENQDLRILQVQFNHLGHWSRLRLRANVTMKCCQVFTDQALVFVSHSRYITRHSKQCAFFYILQFHRTTTDTIILPDIYRCTSIIFNYIQNQLSPRLLPLTSNSFSNVCSDRCRTEIKFDVPCKLFLRCIPRPHKSNLVLKVEYLQLRSACPTTIAGPRLRRNDRGGPFSH